MNLNKNDLKIFLDKIEKLEREYSDNESININIQTFSDNWWQSYLLEPAEYNNKQNTENTVNISKVDLRGYIVFLDYLMKCLPDKIRADVISLSSWKTQHNKEERYKTASFFTHREGYYVFRENERIEREKREEREAAELDRLGFGILPPEKIGLVPRLSVEGVTPPLSENLREWWHDILRNYGKYYCYAVFLALPSDKELVKYLKEFGKELDLISGKNCLVIALSKISFRRSDVDDHIISTLLNKHVSQGHSLTVANILKVKLTEFPCLVIFNDIRSSDYMLINLRGFSAEAIAYKMRETFTIIQEASLVKEKPIVALVKHQTKDILRKNSQTTLYKIFDFTGKTLEKAMEAWISTIIK